MVVKKKGSTSKPVIPFAKLFEMVVKGGDVDFVDSALKTAEEYGWLHDGYFSTKLDEKEKVKVIGMIQELNRKPSEIASIDPAVVFLPKKVGPMVKEVQDNGKTTTLTAGDHFAIVNSKLYRTLCKRHPEAITYLSEFEDGPVYLSERATVAVLEQVADEEEEKEKTEE